MELLRRLWARRQFREKTIVLSYGLLTLLFAVLVMAANPTADRLTRLVFDAYQRINPRPPSGAPIVLVDVDEQSLAELGQWPWPRTAIATLVDHLAAAGAAVIAFDMVFPERDRTSAQQSVSELQRLGAHVAFPPGYKMVDNDQQLAAAFSRAPVVAGISISDETDQSPPSPKAGYGFGGVSPQTYLKQWNGAISNLPELDAAAPGIGFFSFPPSPDGIIREIPLIANAQGKLYPSLSIETLRVAQGAKSIILKSTQSSGEGGGGPPGLVSIKAGAFEVATNTQGSIWIYYSGLSKLTTLPARLVIAPRGPPTVDLQGSIVIVGTSAVGLRDLVATPIAASMPGMRVHAEILDQILSGTFLTRPDWIKGLELSAAVLCGLIVLAAIATAGSLPTSAVAIALTVSAGAASWCAFRYYLVLLDPVLPIATILAVFGVSMPVVLLLTSREKRFVRNAFSYYLAPALVEKLADDPKLLSLGGETRQLTVLFCDIRGFTGLSENLDPTALTSLLNGFLTPMTDVLLAAEATIDKYMGDAIMAFWNAPLPVNDHPRRACVAAWQMTHRLQQVNKDIGLDLRIGIGLNTGDCCVGNLGSNQRFNYSAIGDGVNVASRVEGLCKTFGLSIVLTETVAAQIDDLAILPVDIVRVPGRSRPLKIFTIIGDEAFARTSTYRVALAAQSRFLHHYWLGDLKQARTAFEEVKEISELDLEGLGDFYGRRLDSLEQSAATGWSGVYDQLEK